MSSPRPALRRLAGVAVLLIGISLAVRPVRHAHAVVQVPNGPSAEALLAQVIRAESSLVYRGTMDLNGESTFIVTHGADRRHRQQVQTPPALAGDVIIDNGAMRWHLSPQTAQADVTPSEQLPLAAEARLALIKQNYRLAVQGKATVAGEMTTILSLQPHSHAGMEHCLFVSAAGLPLRTERWRDRQLIEFSAFTSIDWHPKLPATTFEPTLPPGAKVRPAIQVLASGRGADGLIATLTFHPRLPRTLPSGYQVVAVRVYTPQAKHDPTVHWQMSDGMSSLSLFCRKATAWRLPKESRPVSLAGGVSAARMDRGINTMLLWQAGGVRYSLVGPVNQAELTATASETLTNLSR